MSEALIIQLLGGPPLLLAVLVSHLILRRGNLIERRDARAVIAHVAVFGTLSAIGVRFGFAKEGVYIDTALFVVIVAGLQGGVGVGAGAGLVGALARATAWVSLPTA